MPTIAQFYGITVLMYYDDHPPPHVHARYAGWNAQFDIATGDPISGTLPRRAARLVKEWIELHREALAANWARRERGEQIERIEGLE